MTGLLIINLLTVTLPGGAGDSREFDMVRDRVAPILLVVGILVVGMMITISIRGRIARRATSRGTARERMDKVRAEAEARSAGHTLRSEMVETGTMICAQIDARAERLEQLIQHADERLQRLRECAEGEAPAGVRPADHHPGDPAGEGDSHSVSGTEPQVQRTDPLSMAIYDLADEGRSPLEIAQHLDEQVGKVELILALRRSAEPSA